MTWGGWISMTASLAIVIGLFGWCCYKLVVTRDAQDDDVPNAPTTDESVESRRS